MSATAMKWAWAIPDEIPDLSPGAHHVLLCLADRYNPAREAAWPSYADICRRTNQSDRSVRRHIDELVTWDLIRRVPRLARSGRKIGLAYRFPQLDHDLEREKEASRFPLGEFAPDVAEEQRLEVGDYA
ncbi:helix-turn-helix domain-containing protein [Leifsonia aquatica]|uniref:helix-turn-helix domain-containing protein n=1 Tax=Leifsonia aquatica TaxID=144185 RepID=UPI00382B3E3C